MNTHPASSSHDFLQKNLHPKAFRLFFLGLAIAGLAFVAATYLVSTHLVQQTVLEDKVKQMSSNVVVLEDHLAGSLNELNTKLNSIAGFSSEASIRSGRLASNNLAQLIADSRLVRSLAVVDEQGRIISSSNPQEVGILLPPTVLGERDLRSIGQLKMGSVYRVNDLTQLANDPAAQASTGDAGIWLMNMTLVVDKRLYQLLAVLNVNRIQNLWALADADDSVDVILLSSNGRVLLSHQNGSLPLEELKQALLTKERIANDSSIEFGRNHQFIGVFKANVTYDLILAMTIDKKLIFTETNSIRKKLQLVAFILAIGIIVLTALRFSWYQKYENSLIRLKNQSEAIASHLLITESDLQGNIQYVNQGFLDATGYSEQEILGKNYRILDSGLHSATFFSGLWATLQSGKIWHGTLRNKKKSGEFFWVDVSIVPFKNVWGKIVSYLTLYTNITESIAITEKYNQERLLREELAKVNRDLFNDVNTDSLTGVANRRALNSFIEKSIATAREFGSPMSFLMLDLDHFKFINDNYGHHVGDLVLQEMTSRWKKQIRASDMLARIGGEEFCIVLPQAGLQQAKNIAEKIRLATSQAAVRVQNHEELALNISVSIGLASSEGRGSFESTQLMELADAALYRAKNEGRNQVAITQG